MPDTFSVGDHVVAYGSTRLVTEVWDLRLTCMDKKGDEVYFLSDRVRKATPKEVATFQKGVTAVETRRRREASCHDAAEEEVRTFKALCDAELWQRLKAMTPRARKMLLADLE